MSKRLHNPIESALNLTVVDDNELLHRLNAVYNQIVNNPSCLGPQTDLAGFQDVITRYAAAVSAALNGGPAAELERDERRADALRTLRHLANTLPDADGFVDTDGALSTNPRRRPSRRPPPLRSRNKRGTQYRRPPHVESQLCGILASDPTTWSGRAGGFECETLVCLIRLIQDDNSAVYAELTQELRNRVAHRAQKFCGNMDEYDTEQFLSDVDIEVLKLVLTKEPSRQRDFLEVRFGLELERLVGKQFSKFENSTAGNIADIAVDRSNIADTEEGEEVERPIEFLPDPTSGPEEILLNLDITNSRHRLLQKALGAVTDSRHLKAVILHHGHGIPIVSSKRGKDCLTRRFRKTEREVRYWIDQAMQQMRAALGIQVPAKNPTNS